MVDYIASIILGLECTLYGFLGVAIGLFMMGIARKVTARIHNRVGPPIYQPYIDIIKLLSKRTNITHGWIFDLALFFSISGIILTLLFLPIGGVKLLSGYGDIFLILYLLAIPSLGFALGAGASGNPNAGVGVMRALVSMLAYEMPLAIVLIALMIYYNTSSISNIVDLQMQHGWSITVPALFIGAIAMDIALQAMLMEKPFDIPIAPHEIASGPMVEFGGKYLGTLFLFKATSIVVETTLFVDLFLGGGVVLNPATYGLAAYIVNFFVWLVLIIVVFLISIFINGVMPRFRIEQAVKFYWGYPSVIALLSLIGVYWYIWG